MTEQQSDNWVAVGEIRSDVKHLIQASNVTAESIKDLRTELKSDMSKFDTRLNKVETAHWRSAGMLAVIAFAVPAVLTIVGILYNG